MPTLPSSGDVPTVSPQRARDPGLNVPVAAFETTGGIAAAELAPGVGAVARAARRQETRRDTVDRSDKINNFNLEADQQLRDLGQTQDLSKQSVMTEYGAWLAERQQALLAEHGEQGGSRDSMALLTARLQDVAGRATGNAAAISTRIGREKVLKTVDDAVDPLVQRAAQSPTLETINQIYLDLETIIDDNRNGLDGPSDEMHVRQTGQEDIALGAINTLISRGHVEQAAALIDGGLSQALSPESERDVVRRVEGVKFARDEFVRKIAQAEAARGIAFTPEERVQFVDTLFGMGPTQEDLVEIGVRDPETGEITETMFVPQSQAIGLPGPKRTPLVSVTGSIPSGHQVVTENGVTRMEPIPGSPAAEEKQAALQRTAEQAQITARQSRVVVRDIDRALALIDETSLAAGPIVGTFALPGSPAFQLERITDSIKANIGFDQLQMMRAASPTGGALGQVSERENVLLQSRLGSLDIRQEEEGLVETLGQIREMYLDAWFGTPQEHQMAIERGALSLEDVERLNKERETVGFDAIGRALDPGGGQDDSGALTPEAIMAMSRQEIGRLTEAQILAFTPEQSKALDDRMTELGL